MKKETFEKGSFYFNMFGDYYKIMKLLLNGDQNGERTEGYWETAVGMIDPFFMMQMESVLHLAAELQWNIKEKHLRKNLGKP